MIRKESGVLILAPHPDDETLFFGGTVAYYASKGVPVKLVVVTDGSKGGNQEALPSARREECLKAALRLGIHDVEFLDFPDAGICPLIVDQVAAAILARIEEFNPSVIFCFDESGLTTHSDHVWTGIATWKAVTNLLEKTYGINILNQSTLPFLPPFSLRRLSTVHLPIAKDTLEKWSMVDYPRGRITTIDVTGQIDKKHAAAACYLTQKRIVNYFNNVGLLDLPVESFIKRLDIRGKQIYSLSMPLEAKYIKSSLINN